MDSTTLTISTVGYHTIAFDTSWSTGDHCLGLDLFRLTSTVTVTPNLVQAYTNAAVSVQGVSSWTDKTANANHLTQTISSANYPTITTSYNGTGQPALLFNGGNLFLTKAGAAIPTGTADSTFFVVAAQRAPTNSQDKYILAYGGTGTNQARMLGKAASSDSSLVSAQTNSVNVTSGSWSNTLNIAGGVFSAGNVRGNINGSADSSAAIAFNTSSSNLWLGTDTNVSRNWSGAVSEVLVIANSLSSSERAMIEGYLAWKYSITSKLSANHKYKLYAP